ncbi:MAG: acyl-CoA dehydrogenase family protein [Solirubrobacterales bacterium]|nr:acyl-CoA dehydrogenase family protein [Solirubrobacterales bacterium]
MAINLETPKKFKPLIGQAHMVAEELLRPNSRKYDNFDHEYPVELDMLRALIDGMEEGAGQGAGAAGVGQADTLKQEDTDDNKNGTNLSTMLSIIEMCWGDCGLLLTMPGQGLGNSAIAAVANEEQLKRFKGKWAAMAITEPEAGSDSASIRTTAVKDGDNYILNGEKIYVTSGERADLVVVWANVDPSAGRAGIKSFVVERSNPNMKLDRLEEKLGIRASDTAAFILQDCVVHKDNLLGDPEVVTDKGFGGVMQTFDNTRPLVAAMALGVARASLDELRTLLEANGFEINYDKPAAHQPGAVAEFIELEADWEAAKLLTMEAAWMADNRKPNSVQASMAKAKAGRSGTDITLRAVKLAGSVGYSENSLLEKWSRDSKILDIFEGTQQIQLLIIARQLLGLSSSQLK